jgi:flagellar hook-basal body complex protein FliE
MSSSISSINSIPQIPQIPLDQAVLSKSSGEFQNILKSAIQEVEKSHTNATDAVRNFLTGEDGELHSIVLATQDAELQFNMFMQVRNKVVSAYQEIMRMQI